MGKLCCMGSDWGSPRTFSSLTSLRGCAKINQRYFWTLRAVVWLLIFLTYHLLKPFMMKAFPECWSSSFFITLYKSLFSCTKASCWKTTLVFQSNISRHHCEKNLILPHSFLYRRHLSDLKRFGTRSRSNRCGYRQTENIYQSAYPGDIRSDIHSENLTLSHWHSFFSGYERQCHMDMTNFKAFSECNIKETRYIFSKVIYGMIVKTCCRLTLT